MRKTLVTSILLNSILTALLGYLLVRAGGWNQLRLLFNQSEQNQYHQRANLFLELPLQANPVVLLGDTYIAQAEWQEFLPKRTPVLNRGINNDLVQGVQARLPEVIRHQPSIVFLCVGMQDLLLDKPFDQIEKSYFELVKTIQKGSPSTLVVITSLPPLQQPYSSGSLHNQRILELNIRLEQIARTTGTQYLNLYHQLTDSSGNLHPRYADENGLLNTTAYQVWKDQIEKVLAKFSIVSPASPPSSDTLQ